MNIVLVTTITFPVVYFLTYFLSVGFWHKTFETDLAFFLYCRSCCRLYRFLYIHRMLFLLSLGSGGLLSFLCGRSCI